jgi:hypothetical protein
MYTFAFIIGYDIEKKQFDCTSMEERELKSKLKGQSERTGWYIGVG